MVKEQYQPRDYHHGSNRHSKKHRSTGPIGALLPPVPHAQPGLLQSAQQSTLGPAVDPEAMPAKKGLNEWGAFTGGSTASDAGTFGLGPLLFRHASVDENKPVTATTSAAAPPLTGRDLVERDRLLRNDPVSFNPMQAISWAKLAEDVVEEERSPSPRREREPKGKGNGKAVVSSADAKERTRHGGRDGYAAFNTATMIPGASLGTPIPRDVSGRDSEYTEPTPSPVGNMAQTFSHLEVAGSNGYGDFVPPLTASPPPSTTTHRAVSAQPQVRQQRKHRHRHDKKSGQVPTDVYTQQQPGCPPPLASTFPASSNISHQYPAQYQVAYTSYPTTSPPHAIHQAPAPPLPQQQQQQQQDIGLLLCLVPSCQARLPSEAQLNAHYQAFHAPCQYTHGGRQHSSSSADSLGCSWTSCGAGGFTSNNALVWHVKAEHLLLCPVPGCCDRVFQSRKQLDGHVRNRVG